jgi:uncharacterized protein (TIGR03437 family)
VNTYHRLVIYLCVQALGLCAQSPSLTSVQNAASNIAAVFPNGGIAQGSIFVVYGSALGPASIALAPSLPLPTTLSATSIKVTVGSSTVSAPMVYSLATQVAAILPSNIPIGSGTLTLAYSGLSTTIPIQVVASNFGIFTVNQTGTGAGVVTFPDYSVATNAKAAKPGDTLTIWGTGLGAITGSDAVAPAPGDLGTPISVFVGGVQAQVVYRGRSNSPGLDQVNFVMPKGVQGCNVSLATQTDTLVSNIASVAVAPSGGTCSDPPNPLLPTVPPLPTGGSPVTIAVIDMIQNEGLFGTSSLSGNSIGLAFFKTVIPANVTSPPPTGATVNGAPLNIPSVGSCAVSYVPLSNTAPPAAPVNTASLPLADAGMIAVQTPTGSFAVPRLPDPAGYKTAIPSMPPGVYTYANGSGGADIGTFRLSFTLPQIAQWSNEAAVTSGAVDRGKPLTITWSGGDPNGTVDIDGASSAGTAANPSVISFICLAPAAAGSFTIPPSVLLALPPSNHAALGFLGSLGVQPYFTAPGIDYGFFLYLPPLLLPVTIDLI